MRSPEGGFNVLMELQIWQSSCQQLQRLPLACPSCTPGALSTETSALVRTLRCCSAVQGCLLQMSDQSSASHTADSQMYIAGNILLTSGQTSNAHGFCAKISDFGLARDMVMSRIETKTTGAKHVPCLHVRPFHLMYSCKGPLITMALTATGTVTHMPPELLSEGILSKVTGLLTPHLISRAAVAERSCCLLGPLMTFHGACRLRMCGRSGCCCGRCSRGGAHGTR